MVDREATDQHVLRVAGIEWDYDDSGVRAPNWVLGKVVDKLVLLANALTRPKTREATMKFHLSSEPTDRTFRKTMFGAAPSECKNAES